MLKIGLPHSEYAEVFGVTMNEITGDLYLAQGRQALEEKWTTFPVMGFVVAHYL